MDDGHGVQNKGKLESSEWSFASSLYLVVCVWQWQIFGSSACSKLVFVVVGSNVNI